MLTKSPVPLDKSWPNRCPSYLQHWQVFYSQDQNYSNCKSCALRGVFNNHGFQEAGKLSDRFFTSQESDGIFVKSFYYWKILISNTQPQRYFILPAPNFLLCAVFVPRARDLVCSVFKWQNNESFDPLTGFSHFKRLSSLKELWKKESSPNAIWPTELLRLQARQWGVTMSRQELTTRPWNKKKIKVSSLPFLHFLTRSSATGNEPSFWLTLSWSFLVLLCDS